MGSMMTLSPDEQVPFRRGLKKIRAMLNDPARFNELVDRGVREIVPIAGMVTCPNPHYARPFGTLRRSKEWQNAAVVNRCRKPRSSVRREHVRQQLVLLREHLNDRARLGALAEIGPCRINIWDPDDRERMSSNTPSLLVSNFIPECLPNADYSIVPPGTRADAPNGVWFHS